MGRAQFKKRNLAYFVMIAVRGKGTTALLVAGSSILTTDLHAGTKKRNEEAATIAVVAVVGPTK